MDPMDYRVLLMLSSVYRVYGKVRLAQLQPWIDSWNMPEIYAGIEGKGAADAAYAPALEIEHCRVNGTKYTGGAADVYKCFDQIRRDIVYQLLEKAGMPRRIVLAYRSFQEALTVRNTVAGGMGQTYVRPTSIPQGDPMSMMITSLLLRTWVKQMQRHGVTPRILANDLQLLCKGKGHLERFTLGFNKTFQHLEDMGARLAPNLSLIHI